MIKNAEVQKHMFKILVVEDDKELNRTVCAYLNQNGYNAVGCRSADEAYDEFYGGEIFDMIISDIMMPGTDGYEFAKTIRTQNPDIPILFMTAKDDFSSKQRGFLAGVDDYMVKPINVNEMVLRVEALLRRAKMINERKQVIGGTVLEYDYLCVTTSKEKVYLPQKEFMLLYKMASFPGKIFTRQQLMDDVWGYDSDTDSHTLEVHIARLRERFKDNPDFKIVTTRGVGYKVIRT